MRLRDYQHASESAVLREWQDGTTSTLLVLPTGCGKTIVLASIIRSLYPQKTLVIAHREELIWQAKEKIQHVTGLRVEVEMGEHKASMDRELFRPEADVLVATVQTLCSGGDGGGRLGKLNPDYFGAVIVDEAHHSVTDMYKRILDYMRQNKRLKILGVTATPDRQDEEALGQIYETVAHDYEIIDAIRDGWLVPIQQQMVSIESLDFSKIRTKSGDLNGTDLAEVMESEKNLHGIAGATIDICGDQRGIGFASSVNHAQILAEIFNRHRPGMASCVSAKTDKEKRKQIIRQFANGDIQFLWNCGVFTEGFDDSGVAVISMARPTKSRALYAQMAGRATRPHESIAHHLNEAPEAVLRRAMIARSCKPSCLLLDFVGNSGTHKLITSADILGGNVSEEAVKEAVQMMLRTGRPQKVAELLEEKEKEIEERKKQAEARKAKIIVPVKFKSESVDPFDMLQLRPAVQRGWDQGKVLGEGSKRLLRNAMGIDPDKLDYAKGMQLVKEFYRRKENKLATMGQVKWLKKFNLDINMSFDQARACMDALKQNHWRGLPTGFDPAHATQLESPPPRPQRNTQPEIDDVPF